MSRIRVEQEFCYMYRMSYTDVTHLEVSGDSEGVQSKNKEQELKRGNYLHKLDLKF